MMDLSYFLGANTADGFYSRYDSLMPRPGEGTLRVLKGGPGCGKSTLMKKVAAHAAQLGLAVHRIFCASDPTSLDAVLIPAIGYAVVDGTAPHVVEPALCGCDGRYVDLGSGYDETGLQSCRRILRKLKDAAGRCYAPASAALQAAAALERIREHGGSADRSALRKLPNEHGSGGSVRTVFLSGHTPDGKVICRGTMEALCPQLYALRGSAEAVSAILREGAALAKERGWDCLLGDSPLLPGRWAEALAVPGLGVGFVWDSAAFPWNGTVSDTFGENRLDEQLDAMVRRLTGEAGRQLARARELHGLLEEAYRPHLAFGTANRAALDCCAEVEAFAGSR